MKILPRLLLLLILASLLPLAADDFFTVDPSKLHETQDADSALLKIEKYQDQNKQPQIRKFFVPYLEVQAEVKAPMDASVAHWRIYFYDQDRNFLSKVTGAASPTSGALIMPGEKTSGTFAIPDSVMAQTEWKAVVVFGDDKSVDAQTFPEVGEASNYSYDDSKLYDPNGPPIERKPSLPPLIERPVSTFDPNQPTLTLFLRAPSGVKDISQTKGVLAVCLLAQDLPDLRDQLQGRGYKVWVQPLLDFADKHKLMILAWGSHPLWDPQKNWDQLSADEAYSSEQTFNHVADAWEKGVLSLAKDYGIPQSNYLLWGISGSAQYACRLALRKPQYFLAVHVHIPSSFDKPTPDGRKILWCLTTGELEAGHARSLRFYAQCEALGYPIIYKAIEGLGHEYSSDAQALGFDFFEYALSVRDQRLKFDASYNDPLAQFQAEQGGSSVPRPWIASFCKPAYVGDVVNQEMFPSDETDMVPASFRTPLPTKEIAEAWNK